MPLATGLEIAWELTEASGNALDSVGSDPLTEANPSGFATGLVNPTARVIDGSNGHFWASSSPALEHGDADLTYELWYKPIALGTMQTLIAKHNAASTAGSEWLLSQLGDGRLLLEVYQGSSNAGALTCNLVGPLAQGSWHQVIAWHDALNDEIGVRINGVDEVMPWVHGLNATSTAFGLGGILSAGINKLAAHMGPVRRWARVLTSAEHAELNNAGAGRDLAYILGGSPPPARPTLGDWW